jgi:hypothetical protein
MNSDVFLEFSLVGKFPPTFVTRKWLHFWPTMALWWAFRAVSQEKLLPFSEHQNGFSPLWLAKVGLQAPL